MFLKRRAGTRDGKTHHYYSACESLYADRSRVVQRQVPHLGELRTRPRGCAGFVIWRWYERWIL